MLQTTFAAENQVCNSSSSNKLFKLFILDCLDLSWIHTFKQSKPKLGHLTIWMFTVIVFHSVLLQPFCFNVKVILTKRIRNHKLCKIECTIASSIIANSNRRKLFTDVIYLGKLWKLILHYLFYGIDIVLLHYNLRLNCKINLHVWG